MLENMKLKLPSVYKTGTTIAGVIFKVSTLFLCFDTIAFLHCMSVLLCCKFLKIVAQLLQC